MSGAKVIQLIVSVGTLVLFVAVFAAPKKYSEKKLADRARVESKKDTDNQLAEIKKGLKPDAGAKLAELEKRYADAANPAQKVAALDSLSFFWDRQMYPGASILYIEEKAGLLNTPEQWIITGDRYLSMAEFGEPESKIYRLDKAAECYRHVLDKQPDHLTAKTGLGTVLVRKQEDPMSGIALLREVVDADPRNVRALLQLADFSILSNQPDKAIARFDQVLEADPTYVDAYFFKAETYAKMGNKTEALHFLNEYKKRVENPEAAKEAENYLKSNYGL